MDQISYLEGFHRSGWKYVVESLLSLQQSNGILCDTYIDRTFHWKKPSFLPYSQPWIGFSHHTFDVNYSDYNNVKLLQNQFFLDSLPYCKALIVFSNVMKTKWIHELQNIGYSIPVYNLIHPTEFVDLKFTPENFQSNINKKLIQVGAWLRDTYGIYSINNGKQLPLVKKSALLGYKMETYYKPLAFFQLFRNPKWKKQDTSYISSPSPTPTSNTITKNISVNGEIPITVINSYPHTPESEVICRDTICRDIICRDSDYLLNKYVLGAIELLKKYDSSVILLNTVSNNQYDILLSKNIIFLKLVDASAVNTIIECVVRNTPVIVNRLPAVVEILGHGYPLFYNDIEEVPSLITMDNIVDAYNYLLDLDKSIFDIHTFMQNFIYILDILNP